MNKETTKRYVTVRDIDSSGSKDGKFFVNEHDYSGGVQVASSDHQYNQKRSARRAARNLAKREGYEYRQDQEYTRCNFPKMTAPLAKCVV